MTSSRTLTETQFKECVVEDLLQLPDCWFLKTQERGRHGVLDLLICLRGHFVAIELKKRKGRVQKLQLLNIEKIKSAGGTAFIADQDTWAAQFAVLKQK